MQDMEENCIICCKETFLSSYFSNANVSHPHTNSLNVFYFLLFQVHSVSPMNQGQLLKKTITRND
jgi:hypothetical protein